MCRIAVGTKTLWMDDILHNTLQYFKFFLDLSDHRDSPMGAVMQAVVEGLAENRVLVVDSPSGL